VSIIFNRYLFGTAKHRERSVDGFERGSVGALIELGEKIWGEKPSDIQFEMSPIELGMGRRPDDRGKGGGVFEEHTNFIKAGKENCGRGEAGQSLYSIGGPRLGPKFRQKRGEFWKKKEAAEIFVGA